MKKVVRALSLAVTVVLAASGFSAYASDSSALQGKWKGPEAGRPTEGACLLTVSGNTLEFRAADTNEWYKGTFTPRGQESKATRRGNHCLPRSGVSWQDRQRDLPD